MGMHESTLAFIAQMRRAGPFKDVQRICDLGDQQMGLSNNPLVVRELFEAFGKPAPTAEECVRYHDTLSRDLYTRIGLTYMSIDVNAEGGAIPLDLNFEPAPDNQKNAWDLVCNQGTTEHLINQANAFQVIHDLTRKGGYMLHHLPFLRYVDHGYFNYQPNFFEDLAIHNDYEIIGIWINLDRGRCHLIPWHRTLLEKLRLDNLDMNIFVLFRKTSDAPFALPVQGTYAGSLPEPSLRRYEYLVDGRLIKGREGLVRARAASQPDLGLSSHPVKDLQREVIRRYVRAIKRRLGLK
ncbi:MAG: hypothetical protein KG075_16680 [Alphaproteobacteria bacterium]|nr:hypothetical protein [Alphaproteobacteria bacterium]